MSSELKGYEVNWWFTPAGPRSSACLSAGQHRNMREAAESVLMQNPNATVRVVSPRGGGMGQDYHYRAGQVVRAWTGGVLRAPENKEGSCR